MTYICPDCRQRLKQNGSKKIWVCERCEVVWKNLPDDFREDAIDPNEVTYG